jgi:hypothetical protein
MYSLVMRQARKYSAPLQHGHSHALTRLSVVFIYILSSDVLKRCVHLLALYCIVNSLIGCVWRTSESERYFGPVLVRYDKSGSRAELVFEQIHLPFVFEGGAQWGLSLGLRDRIAAVAKEPGNINPLRHGEAPPRWASPLSVSCGRERGWILSLLFMKVENVARPEFLAHSVLGFQMQAGAEMSTVTAGYSSTTRFQPQDDASYVLDYRNRHPMDLVFIVCKWNQAGFDDHCKKEMIDGTQTPF